MDNYDPTPVPLLLYLLLKSKNMNRATTHFTFDFSFQNPFEFDNFVKSILEEYCYIYDNLISENGFKFSSQNPDTYLHMLRLFFNPFLVYHYSHICDKKFFGTTDPCVIHFVTLFLDEINNSLLMTRSRTCAYLDAFEYAMYDNSLLFNTCAQHSADPRKYSMN